jgi:hypothetical protein
MKKLVRYTIAFIVVFIFHCSSIIAQTLTPQVSPSCGGYSTAGGNNLSWTMGQPFNATLQNGNSMLTQGFQQPYIELKILNLRAFIEGFYLGNGLMEPVLYLNDPLAFSSNVCDSMTVELHAAVSPFSLVASVKVLLQTDGSAIARFPSSTANTNYYIALRHRNTIETWSASPVLLSNHASYNFTSAANTAYGNNLRDLADGNFAIWSGDVNQDGLIEEVDFISIEISLLQLTASYQTTDLTGDGMVESTDYSLIENNSEQHIARIRP